MARRLDSYAYLISPGAAVIGAVLGAALTVWPPTTAQGKIAWVVSFAVVGVVAIAGTILDRRIGERQQAARDAQITMNRLRAEEMIRDLRVLSKRDVPRLNTARHNAAFLARQIHDFLKQYPPPQIPTFPAHIAQEDLLFSPELIRYSNVSRRYEFQVNIEYQEKFKLQAINVATELARAGEVDDVLLVLIHNVFYSGMLKMVADRFQALAEGKP